MRIGSHRGSAFNGESGRDARARAPASGAIRAVPVRFREKFIPRQTKGTAVGRSIVGSNGGKRLVRRMTNPIRPDVLGEPVRGERSPKLD